MISIPDVKDVESVEQAKDILSDQASLISSCAFVLEHPSIRGSEGQDITASVAVLLHSAEQELRRVAERLEALA